MPSSTGEPCRIATTHAPAWLKPAKFAISISIYCFTLLWLLTHVRRHERTVRLISAATALGLALEEAIIVGQVVRGTTSHFNFSAQLDSTLYGVMGLTIIVVLVANLATVVLLLLQHLPDQAFDWSLRLGLIISLVGMGVAALMLLPTPAQLSATETSGTMAITGAHSVGVEDGGPGLPVVGWSTTGGDLRAAHFFGLHALQVMPLIGFLVSSQRARWLGARHRVCWCGRPVCRTSGSFCCSPGKPYAASR